MTNHPDNDVTGTAQVPILPMGTGSMLWHMNKDICNRKTLHPFDALMTVCKVRIYFFM